MSIPMRLLVVEDDVSNASFLQKGFREAGHNVVVATTGTEALSLALDEDFDVIILDRMLPKIDGLSILRTLRAENNSVPVVLLSALAQLDHRVEGLKAGADDYLVKPFGFSELLLRVEMVARRRGESGEKHAALKVEDLELDLLARKASRGGAEIELLPKEYAILEYMMRNPGRVVTRTMLLEHVWEYQFDPQTNVVDVHISRLRKKIDGGHEHALIQTVRGAGYKIG